MEKTAHTLIGFALLSTTLFAINTNAIAANNDNNNANLAFNVVFDSGTLRVEMRDLEYDSPEKQLVEAIISSDQGEVIDHEVKITGGTWTAGHLTDLGKPCYIISTGKLMKSYTFHIDPLSHDCRDNQ